MELALILLIWNAESLVGYSIIILFCGLLNYFAFFGISEKVILKLFIELDGKEPFTNAAKVLSYFFKAVSLIVSIGVLFLLIMSLFSFLFDRTL